MKTHDAPVYHRIDCRCDDCVPVQSETQLYGTRQQRMRRGMLVLAAYVLVLVLFGLALILATVK